MKTILADIETLAPPLLESALRGSLLLAASALIVLAFRKRSAACKHLVWITGIATLLAMPLILSLLPTLAWLPKKETPAMVVDSPAPPPTQVTLVEPTAPVAETAGMTEPAKPSALSLSTIFFALWILGAGLLICRLAIGHLKLWFRGHKKSAPPCGTLLAQLELLRQSLEISKPVRLKLDQRCTIPMTWGTLRPVVLLPADAESWAAERQHAVLCHELAHIKRQDAATDWLVQLACALHWFNPLVWFAAHRTEVEREAACDNLVLEHGCAAPDYAQHLLQIVTRPSKICTGAVAMAKSPKIENRILAILGDRIDRRSVTKRFVLSLTIIATVVSLPIMLIGAEGGKVKASPSEIHIPKAGKTVIFNGADISTTELAKQFAEMNNKQRFVISADKETPLVRVTSVLSILSKAGVQEITFGTGNGNSAEGKKTVQLDVTKLTTAPPGRYALNLVIEGETIQTEFEIKDGIATCTKSEKAPGARILEGARGEFYPGKNGVFMIRIHGKGYTASQAWVFQSDGSAHVKEIPDRNENQRAIPITETKNK